MSLVM